MDKRENINFYYLIIITSIVIIYNIFFYFNVSFSSSPLSLTRFSIFYILSCGKGNIGYIFRIRDYSLFDIGIYITSIIILGIKPGAYSLI